MRSLCRFGVISAVLVSLCVSGIIVSGVDSANAGQLQRTAGPDTLRVIPFNTRVLVGTMKQFSVSGGGGDYSWIISDSSATGVGTIDADGLFTALAGGWVIIAAQDGVGSIVASSDTIVVMGGRTTLRQGGGGRAFSEDDTLVVADFPPEACDRALTVQIRKRDTESLPEEARLRVRTVAVFEFSVEDADTGEDVGEDGFAAMVRLTLHYEDGDIPEDVEEGNLTVAYFNQERQEWEGVPEEDVVETDPEGNMFTVETGHASLWAVVDDTSLVTPVPGTSWGGIKRQYR